MRFRFSLRYRVALTFLMLGWLVSMAMGGILYWLTIRMEKQLIEEILSIELEDYMSRYASDSTTPPPSSAHIQGYTSSVDAPETLPITLRRLPLGLSHVRIDGSGFYVEIIERNTTRFLMLYADELIKNREKQYLGFLTLGIVVMTLLSSVSGLWLAGRVILPVTRLARQVSKMGPDFSPLPVKEGHPYDEVTLAIDGYHQRLAEFNERERAFTSDVSHELRTPLAVIEGASEVMLSKNDLGKDNRKRIERIMRATTQITRLTTALLALAREESDSDSHPHQCPVDKILIKVVEEHQYLLNHKSVEVNLDANSDLVTRGDSILLYVVLANIVRNAFSYTQQGTVHIRLEGERIVIEDTGAGMREDQLLKMFNRYYSENHSKGGHGVGLSLVARICERYGWAISIRSHEGRGTSVELLLN
ncbi:MAG: histidine kinase [Thiothrix sp.]|nr:MAG: histidine kinase [Thiothrix sp.]